MKKVFLFAVVLIFILSTQVYASDKVTVQIPNFDITINDVIFDNENAAYPFITYKGITYFPLTYNLCSKIGMTTSWNSEKGLYIARYSQDIYSDDNEISGNYKKGRYYTASIPKYPVVFNGININSEKQYEYPVLNFKNITYLPMTWDYAYNELGLDVEWDSKKGLSLNIQGKDISFYLTEINDTYALFESYKSIYKEKQNEDGSITYYHDKDEIKEYRLEYSTNNLSFVAVKDKASDISVNNFEDISDLFRIESGILFYKDIKIDNFSDFNDLDAPGIRGLRRSYDGKDFLEITLYTDTSIPAPYTPSYKYIFIEEDGIVNKIEQWNQGDSIDNIFKVKDDYYICSSSRHITGRFNSNLSTILKIGADGKVEIINDKFKDYKSLKAIGVHDNKLYVLATWFGDTAAIGKGKVSALNDGYFYLNENDELNKIYNFVEGEAFLAPNGNLYLISPDRVLITDLSAGLRIKE